VAINPTKYIWHNGSFVPWHSATTHVLAHGLHYGSSVFEGLRAYETPDGPAVFRLKAHVARLFESAKIYQIDIPYTRGEIERACLEAVSVNGLCSAYLRPIAYRGVGTFSLSPRGQTPVEVAIAAIEWGAYLGNSALRDGVDVCVSSWTRLAPNTVPVLAKASGHYLSSQLIATEAARHGYAEGIALDGSGCLSEGSSENLFVVRDNVICTTPVAASILQGITRDTVLKLADYLGLAVREQAMPREILYVADEVFFTGTAAEITPVRSVDRTPVGTGKPGPITRALQEAFFGLFDGSMPDHWGWLDYVPVAAAKEKAVADEDEAPVEMVAARKAG
jgi:branched-chain amino acid aminotransferase